MLQNRDPLWYGARSAIGVLAAAPSWSRDKAQYTLTIRGDALDDDFYQVWFRMFIWLAQYSATQGWVGYYREQPDGPLPGLVHQFPIDLLLARNVAIRQARL